MTNFTPGDVSGSQTLTDNDSLYPDLFNELRQSRAASAVVGTTEQCEYYCDGTDDDAQIQEAIDAVAAEGGGVVYIKKGTYSLSEKISITTDHITLMGEGESILDGSSLAASTPIIFNSSDYTNFIGLHFKNGSHYQINQGDYSICRDCIFETDGGNIYAVSIRSNSMFINNKVIGAYDSFGIVPNGSNIVISGNVFNCQSSCIELGYEGDNIVISNNNITAYLGDGGTFSANYGIWIYSRSGEDTSCKNVIISNNTIDGDENTIGIKVSKHTDAEAGHFVGDVLIDGNIINGVSTAIYLEDVTELGNCERVAINNNLCHVNLRGVVNQGFTGVSVKNNKFYSTNNGTNAYGVFGTKAIDEVVGNYIYYFERGIYPGAGCLILNNTIDTCVYGVRDGGTSVIIGNKGISLSNRMILSPSGTSVIALNSGYTGNDSATQSVLNVTATKLGVGVLNPTAFLHLPACTAAAGTASIKIPPGTVASTPVSGNIESDGTHLYWTDSGRTRRQLDPA